MGSCSHLQGIFQIQGLNPCVLCLLRWQADCLPLRHLEPRAKCGWWDEEEAQRKHRFPFGGCHDLSFCESLAKNGICHHLSATKRHLKVVRATVVWFSQRKYLFKYLKILSAYLKQFRIVYSIKWKLSVTHLLSKYYFREITSWYHNIPDQRVFSGVKNQCITWVYSWSLIFNNLSKELDWH